MHVASLRLDLIVAGCRTGRRRRYLLEEMIGRLRRHFNVAAAEDEAIGPPDRAALVVAAVGQSRREVRETLERVAEAVAVHPLAELVGRSIHDL